MPYYANQYDLSQIGTPALVPGSTPVPTYSVPIQATPRQYYGALQQPQQFQQSTQYQSPQPAPQSQSRIFIWIHGIEEANNYQVAPNSTIDLWDNTERRIFLKSADSTGMTSMKILNYTIEDVPNLISQNIQQQTAAPSPAQAEFDSMKSDVRDLATMVKTLADDLQEFRNDLYGVAGKPTTRKETKTNG